jgi:uncharacterized membrane protein YjjP (DUF1212 family)
MPPEPDDYRRKARFIVKLGIALHECGGTSQRVERHLLNVTRQLGFHGSFLISPTTFTCAFWQDASSPPTTTSACCGKSTA